VRKTGSPGTFGLSKRHESEDRIRATLDQAVRQVYPDPAGAGVQTRLAYGHPSQALVEASKGASLLVVGSRGQGAFTGMLLGSVSMHCVTSASCPGYRGAPGLTAHTSRLDG
jgi:nucleotide-binding universal stress UspA family protein